MSIGVFRGIHTDTERVVTDVRWLKTLIGAAKFARGTVIADLVMFSAAWPALAHFVDERANIAERVCLIKDSSAKNKSAQRILSTIHTIYFNNNQFCGVCNVHDQCCSTLVRFPWGRKNRTRAIQRSHFWAPNKNTRFQAVA